MKMSEEGLIELAGHEGLVTSRYLDSAKPPVWTIGVGHTAAAGGLDPRASTASITIQKALDLFRADIVKYERGVNNAVTVSLTQHEFDALVSFHYNTGAIGKASFVKKLNATGNRAEAARGMMEWVKPPELKARRTKERDLFLEGRYSNGGVVMAYPATPSGKVIWNQGKRVDVKALLRMGQVDAPPAAAVAPKPTLWARLKALAS